MDELNLIRNLNSVGKAVFVEYYQLFKDYSTGKSIKEHCIDYLVSKRISNSNGASIRCSNAKQIFQAQKEMEALKIILDSDRLSYDVKEKARNLLNKKK